LVEGLRCYLCTSKEDPQTCSYDQFDYDYAHSCEPASTPLKEGCTDDGLSCACAQDLCNHGNQLVAPTFVLCYVVMLLCNGIYSF
ncbi:hypothetical protein MAR_001098, partial [Mya arenaria]